MTSESHCISQRRARSCTQAVLDSAAPMLCTLHPLQCSNFRLCNQRSGWRFWAMQRQMLYHLHPFAMQRAQAVHLPGHAALLDDAAPPTFVVADREQVSCLLPKGGSLATLGRGSDQLGGLLAAEVQAGHGAA